MFKFSFWFVVVVNIIELALVFVVLFMKDTIMSIAIEYIKSMGLYSEVDIDYETLINNVFGVVIFFSVIITVLPLIFLIVPYSKSIKDSSYKLGTMFKSGLIFNIIIYGIGFLSSISPFSPNIFLSLIMVLLCIYLFKEAKNINPDRDEFPNQDDSENKYSSKDEDIWN